MAIDFGKNDEMRSQVLYRLCDCLDLIENKAAFFSDMNEHDIWRTGAYRMWRCIYYALFGGGDLDKPGLYDFPRVNTDADDKPQPACESTGG